MANEELDNNVSNEQDVLKALLSVDHKVEKDFFMKRFGVNFRLQAIDGVLLDRIQEQCTYYTGKGSKRTKKFDEQKFSALVIQKGCLVPDWNDRKLLDAYNTHDAVDVIKKRLLAGELATLSAEIMDLSGFQDDEEEMVEDVKNS